MTTDARRQAFDYWVSTLGKMPRSEFWARALTEIGLTDISQITWPILLKLEKNSQGSQLGRKGSERVAQLAGIGDRPTRPTYEALLVKAKLLAATLANLQEADGITLPPDVSSAVVAVAAIPDVIP